MENKRRKNSYKQYDADSSSSSSEDIRQRHDSGVQRSSQNEEPGGGSYGAYLASLSDGLNAGAHRFLSPNEQPTLDTASDMTRRFGFRRCRKHRKEEMQQLEAEKLRLTLETHQLAVERARLQDELRFEISMANIAGNNSVAATQFQVHEPRATLIQDNQAQLLQSQQRQTQRQFFPNIAMPANVPMFSQMMPTGASLNVSDTAASQQRAAMGRAILQMSRQQDEMGYLPRFHTNQEEAASLRQPAQSPTIAPQILLSPRMIMERRRELEAMRRMESSQAFTDIIATPKNPPRSDDSRGKHGN